jgi:microcystin-dependent protein
LIGTTYGGDGQETFNLPNLQSRVPIHMGTGPDGITYPIGQLAGTEQETLTTQQIPIHSHPLIGSGNIGTEASPAGNLLATPTTMQAYALESPDANLAASSITPVGGSQPHENVQPFLCINFIISLFGVFPTQ